MNFEFNQNYYFYINKSNYNLKIKNLINFYFKK